MSLRKGGQEGENIYEELERRRRSQEDFNLKGEEVVEGVEEGEGVEGEGEGLEESYDHLNFARTQELKPHYQSTDTLRSSPHSRQSR